MGTGDRETICSGTRVPLCEIKHQYVLKGKPRLSKHGNETKGFHFFGELSL